MSRASEAKTKPKTPVPIPTGTVTFLFTDIEGSTQRWDAHPGEMEHAVERHDKVMRAAIEKHRGYIFKTVGDAFCAAFGTPDKAVAAAIDAQRSLATEDFSAIDGLSVRMAVHVGQASERDGDYFGPTVNRVARLMSIGHGGQVLISDAVYDLVRIKSPTDVTFVDLGLRRLRDLTQPEQVWQVSAEGTAAAFPQLNSLDARANNLPIQTTVLFGREHDLDEIEKLVSKHRLVTLSGSGGVGKTRVALQVGANLIDRFPHGVWLADFAPIRDLELVSSVVAKALDISVSEGRNPYEAIAQSLKCKQLLLILDNCEHVLTAVTGLIDAILKTAPYIRLLATSRQALSVGGEVVHRLPSLAVPENKTDLTVEEAMRFGAVALFIARAEAANTQFNPTRDNMRIVVEICRHLDGIPLALELAAARVKILTIPNLARHLNDRFRLLSGGNRTAMPRQKTLSALIDWSYNLLTQSEQKFFNRIGIFAGSFTLDAVTAVSADESIDTMDIVDLLSSLTDKSLVSADTTAKQERYRLLESTRAYAMEKLAARGECEQLSRRHAEYFHDQAQRAYSDYGTGSSAEWLAGVEPEIDNYRATLEWALTKRNNVVLGGAVAGALSRLWLVGGLTVEGRYWIDRALACIEESTQPQVAARLWRALAGLSSGKRLHDCAERALALFLSTGDRGGAAWSLEGLGFGLLQMGRYEDAGATYERSLSAMRDLCDIRGVAVCLGRLANIRRYRGDVAGGRKLFAQALEAQRARGDEAGAALALSNLAELEFADGQVKQALCLSDQAIEIYKRGKNAMSLANGYVNNAAYSIALGDTTKAREAARDGLRWARQAQDSSSVAIALQHLALLGALRGRAHDAARLIGYVNLLYEELECERESTERWAFEKLMAILHEKLSEDEVEELAWEGAAWSVDQAVEQAMKV